MNDSRIKEIREMLQKSDNIVFFGGAGTSTESNIPDFRSAERGLYQRSNTLEYPPEELLSSTMINSKPELFFAYYFKHLVHPEARPNKTHQVLAKWEKSGKLQAVITQNIDGLHQMAGNQNVLELHGSLRKHYCIKCGGEETLETLLAERKDIPRCKICEGMIRPDVVLYGETLKSEVLEASVQAISKADFLIVGGSSLIVHPAAGLINYYRGNKLLIINHDPTPLDHRARWVIHHSIGETMEKLDGEVIE